MPEPTKKNPIHGDRKPVTVALAAVVLAAAAAGAFFLAAVDPAHSSLLPPCVFHELTGLYCAGCGISRALHLLLNGQFYAGLRMNPLAVLSLPLLLGWLTLAFVRHFRGKALPRIPSWVPWAAIAVIVFYTVARNLPWEPFSWLAPRDIGIS
jgi:hypothetical protein